MKKRSYTPEVKILCLSVFYVLVYVFSLTQFSQIIAKGSELGQDLAKFIICNIQGVQSVTEKYQNVENIVDHAGVALEITANFLLGLIPIANIAFAMKSSDFMKLLKCFRRREKAKKSDNDLALHSLKKTVATSGSNRYESQL